MTVALPTEPANYFHLLRRHALDGIQRPLIVFTPKSMLRNKAVVSPVADFTGGRFRLVIDDPRYRELDSPRQPASAPCSCAAARSTTSWPPTGTSGDRRRRDRAGRAALPGADRQIAAVLDRYPNAEDVRWVQEEPANQGAWPFFGLDLPEKLPRLAGMQRVSRRRMAAPAPGSSKVHEVEQNALIDAAFEHDE